MKIVVQAFLRLKNANVVRLVQEMAAGRGGLIILVLAYAPVANSHRSFPFLRSD
jgi:hypothetical protein